MALDQEIFEDQCRSIGGEYNRKKIANKIYHDCRIDNDKKPGDDGYKRRKLQWVEDTSTKKDTASTGSTAGSYGEIVDPQISTVDEPSVADRQAAADVGVPVRSKMIIKGRTDENGKTPKVSMHGRPV